MTNVIDFISPVQIIARLNDTFRRTFAGGRVVMTSGIADLPDNDRLAIVQAVRSFNTFGEANDPYGEHDFGAIENNGEKVFWKIDYYDSTLEHGSENPADPGTTTRVLTIMLASEY